jgi:hypothetical protein
MRASKLSSVLAIPLFFSLSGCDEPVSEPDAVVGADLDDIDAEPDAVVGADLDDIDAEPDADDEVDAVPDGDAHGLAAPASDPVAVCDAAGTFTNTAYTYNYGGHSYTFDTHKAGGVTTYLNRQTNGGWFDLGTLSKWTDCPTGNEQVISDPSTNTNGVNGPAKTCTHVCLPGNKEELHCPNAQIALTRTSRVTDCVHSAATAGWRNECDAQRPDPGYCASVFQGTNLDCTQSCETCWEFKCQLGLGGANALIDCNKTRPISENIPGCFSNGGSYQNGGNGAGPGPGVSGSCPEECRYNDNTVCLCSMVY